MHKCNSGTGTGVCLTGEPGLQRSRPVSQAFTQEGTPGRGYALNIGMTPHSSLSHPLAGGEEREVRTEK